MLDLIQAAQTIKVVFRIPGDFTSGIKRNILLLFYFARKLSECFFVAIHPVRGRTRTS